MIKLGLLYGGVSRAVCSAAFFLLQQQQQRHETQHNNQPWMVMMVTLVTHVSISKTWIYYDLLLSFNICDYRLCRHFILFWPPLLLRRITTHHMAVHRSILVSQVSIQWWNHYHYMYITSRDDARAKNGAFSMYHCKVMVDSTTLTLSSSPKTSKAADINELTLLGNETNGNLWCKIIISSE